MRWESKKVLFAIIALLGLATGGALTAKLESEFRKTVVVPTITLDASTASHTRTVAQTTRFFEAPHPHDATANGIVPVHKRAASRLFSHSEQCVDSYTLKNGNPFCVELVSDSGTNNGTVDDPKSAAWITAENRTGSGASFNNVSAPVDTQPGGANYGRDPNIPMFYNPNGAASISTVGEIEYVNVTCDNSASSCGHSWVGADVYLPANARGQNPSTDHHLAVQGVPCQSAGVSSPANVPPYAVAGGNRCEMDFWAVEPAAPTVIPTANANGASFTAKGEGQCDLDARLGFYNASGSTASQVCLGTSLNPADLVTAIESDSWMPYALNTAVYCTGGSYTFPASYFDGYESGNTTCPPEGARYHSNVTDAQVNATSWPPALKALMRTLYHYGGIITDTTGDFGNGFSIQMIGGSGFTVNASNDSAEVDPIRWIAHNGGAGTASISDDGGGSETGIGILLSNILPYSITNNFAFCKVDAMGVHYMPSSTLPKTCGNV